MLIPFIYQYQSQLCQQPNPAPWRTAIPSNAKINIHFQVTEKMDGCSQASTGPQALPWQSTTLNSFRTPQAGACAEDIVHTALFYCSSILICSSWSGILPETCFSLTWVRAEAGVQVGIGHSKMLQDPTRWVLHFTLLEFRQCQVSYTFFDGQV